MNVDAAVCRLLDISNRRNPSRLHYAREPRPTREGTGATLAPTVLLTLPREEPKPYQCPHCGAVRR